MAVCEQLAIFLFNVFLQPMRIDVLRVIFEKIGIAYDTDDDVLARAAKQMDGYTAADMQNVVEKAAHLAISELGT
jgi:SpoVK/Ycf46/Vps4 family AAA+-type ATPase